MSRKLFVTLVALLVLGLGGVAALTSATATAAPEQKPLRAQEIPVQLAEARDVQAQSREEVTGALAPAKGLQLGFEVGGRLRRVLVQKGNTVKEGELLGQLDPEISNAQVEQALAALAAAEAGATLAGDVAQRNTQLQAEGSVSEVQSLSATATSKQAAAQRQGAKAQLAQARAARRRHDLRAPFSGTLIDAPEQVGATVAPGMALFKLEQLDTLLLKTSVSETQREKLKVGARVRVESVSGGAFTEDAVVRTILPSADPATRRVPVEISVPNPDARFTAHTLARAVLPLGEAMRAQVIPASALSSAGGDHVWVLGPNATARRVAVQVVDRGAREVTVRAPEALTRVIDFPAANLTDGTRVSVK